MRALAAVVVIVFATSTPEVDVRRRTAWELAHSAAFTEESLAALVAGALDPDAFVREWSVRGLGRSGLATQPVLRTLAFGLEDGDWTVRRQAALAREIPYGLAVEVGAVEDGASLARIDAVIWVAKDSQRSIVIGRGGSKLKAIGRAARTDLERLLGKKVFLQTHVKVRRNWADDARALREFGYEAEK